MSDPSEQDWEGIKRLARYLVNSRRCITHFACQEGVKAVAVWVDSDWAGDWKDRKSTSGGVLRFGNHTIKTWSSTQKHVATSSAEAEYYAIEKGGSIGICLCSLFWDLGINVNTKVIL